MWRACLLVVITRGADLCEQLIELLIPRCEQLAAVPQCARRRIHLAGRAAGWRNLDKLTIGRGRICFEKSPTLTVFDFWALSCFELLGAALTPRWPPASCSSGIERPLQLSGPDLEMVCAARRRLVRVTSDDQRGKDVCASNLLIPPPRGQPKSAATNWHVLIG